MRLRKQARLGRKDLRAWAFYPGGAEGGQQRWNLRSPRMESMIWQDDTGWSGGDTGDSRLVRKLMRSFRGT